MDKTTTKPTSKRFAISAPYVEQGRINLPLAATENFWMTIKVNAEGGENAIHSHLDEDHSFIVLEGEVTFYDEHDHPQVLGPYEGIMIPAGAFYRYLNTGGKNLFLLRTGCRVASDAPKQRIKPDGSPIKGSSKENKHVDGVPIPGKIFGKQIL
jgi:mannose-6-phosphate isomerase-like protein (cupin superfamily)